VADADPSAHAAAAHDVAGASPSLVIAEVTLGVAWNVRGDPARSALAPACAGAFALALPQTPNTSTRGEKKALLWLGPRSWLFVGAPGAAPDDFDATREALRAVGAALFDVSASYVAWSLTGSNGAAVVNAGCPLDLHPRAFPAGACAQSLLGHVGALVYRPDDAERFVVMVPRSYSADAWHDLRTWAESAGYRMGSAQPFPG
jgi:sarcosine oxidase subunit gamma